MPDDDGQPSPVPPPQVPAGVDLWARVPTLATALNPLLLLVIGWMLNHGIDENRQQIELAKVHIQENGIKLSEVKTAAETQSIALQQRVDKVKVISEFINDLSGPDERRRSLAIEAILIALPDESARLLKVVERFAQAGNPASIKDRETAVDALAGTRDHLVADMFSSQRAMRLEAFAALQRNWLDDAGLLGLLLARAAQEVSARAAAGWPTLPDDAQRAGIYNTVSFLNQVRAPADPGLRAKALAFLQTVEPNSDDTRRVAAAAAARFR